MIKQSNALQRLKDVLSKANETGNNNEKAGPLLLKSMCLEAEPSNLIDFYELLNKAVEEVRKLEYSLSESDYIHVLLALQKVCIERHLWSVNWATVSTHINSTNTITILSLLASKVHGQKPTILFDQTFLDELKLKFESLFERVRDSDLSDELKRFLLTRIDDILIAIRRYHVDGSQGLEKTNKLLIADLLLKEHEITPEDKKNPLLKSVMALPLVLVGHFFSFSAVDLISAVPAVNTYWIPRIEVLTSKTDELVGTKPSQAETETLQDFSKSALTVIDSQSSRNRIEAEKPREIAPASPAAILPEPAKETEEEE